jgi:hypothetical protein
VHHLLLEGVDDPLAAHYRSVCARRGLAYVDADDETVGSAFAEFCHAHHDEVVERCATRATQTNEVGRCAVLRPALASLGGDAPLGLLDAGCSAGLNLLVDAYRYDYGARVVGEPDAVPVLRCELLGAPPPLDLPPIADRVGLDLEPVDVADDDAVAWLLACLWPDDLSRFERLEEAIAVAGRRRDELTLRQGDMVDGLADAAACVDAPRIAVVDSWSAAYLPSGRRRAFADAVAAIGAARPTAWVTLEYPTVARELGVLATDARYAHRGASVVCVTTFEDGRSCSRLVAETHAHGRWLDWRASG